MRTIAVALEGELRADNNRWIDHLERAVESYYCSQASKPIYGDDDAGSYNAL